MLVSGTGSNLQALLDQIHGREGVEIVCVGSSNPQAQGLERAQNAGVATGVFTKDAYESRELRDAAMGDWLDGHGVDLVVLAGFMELLGSAFIERFRGRIVNVHPSLLPAFAGVRAIEQALEHGVQVMGVTVHFVDEGVDSGPIILQESFPLPYPADIETVETRVHEIEHALLPRAVGLIAMGAIRVEGRRVRVEDAGR